MSVGGVLEPPVQEFVDALTPVLTRLSPKVTEVDLALEAFELAASFVDSDGRHSDGELRELIITFAPYLSHLVGATPELVRRNELVAGKRGWKRQPSALFQVLLAHDKASSSRDSWRYYELAMPLAHAVVAIDAHTATEELADLDELRSVLLTAMRTVGVDRPGAATPAGTPPAAGPTTPGASADPSTPTPQELPERSVDDLLAELDELIGMASVKAEVRLVTNLLRVQRLRQERGLPVVEGSRHLVFTGNPGTGKTTVARLMAQIYRALKVVSKGQLVEADRSGMVAGFVGQTALKVKAVIESALGGFLLIDEAYALARGSDTDFGREAIDTLVKLMEDHRDDLVIVAAGYPDEMHTFIESNPGLRSRFPKTIKFEDFTDDELVDIFELQCKKSKYRLTPQARRKVRDWFAVQPRDKGFGNGRLARNLFEAAVAHHASRIVAKKTSPTDDELITLRPSDIPVEPPSRDSQRPDVPNRDLLDGLGDG
jgi:AAA+ superfamily predicted ATPase